MYPGATLTVARGNPQYLALNESPSNHLVENLEHKHLTMKFDIVGIHCRTSFKSKSAGVIKKSGKNNLIALHDSPYFPKLLKWMVQTI